MPRQYTRKVERICRCGKTVLSPPWAVRKFCSKSCRYAAARGHRWNITHGMTNTPEFSVWKGMIQRCRYPGTNGYERYGGRGIKVCDRWLGEDGFANFFADMGGKPSPNHSLDRIDSDGNYEPSNCRWSTRSQQQRNTSYNHIITHDGLSLCIQEWAERIGIDRCRIDQRLQRGWSVTDALTTPVIKKPRLKR